MEVLQAAIGARVMIRQEEKRFLAALGMTVLFSRLKRAQPGMAVPQAETFAANRS
jgi:hypothetical protein